MHSVILLLLGAVVGGAFALWHAERIYWYAGEALAWFMALCTALGAIAIVMVLIGFETGWWPWHMGGGS